MDGRSEANLILLLFCLEIHSTVFQVEVLVIKSCCEIEKIEEPTHFYICSDSSLIMLSISGFETTRKS